MKTITLTATTFALLVELIREPLSAALQGGGPIARDLKAALNMEDGTAGYYPVAFCQERSQPDPLFLAPLGEVLYEDDGKAGHFDVRRLLLELDEIKARYLAAQGRPIRDAVVSELHWDETHQCFTAHVEHGARLVPDPEDLVGIEEAGLTDSDDDDTPTPPAFVYPEPGTVGLYDGPRADRTGAMVYDSVDFTVYATVGWERPANRIAIEVHDQTHDEVLDNAVNGAVLMIDTTIGFDGTTDGYARRMHDFLTLHLPTQIGRVNRMIQVAAGLVGDGCGNEVGNNPEHERGIAELICRANGLAASDYLETMMERIRFEARKKAAPDA